MKGAIEEKWSRILAAKRYGGVDPIELTAVEQQELLDDLRSIEQGWSKPVDPHSGDFLDWNGQGTLID